MNIHIFYFVFNFFLIVKYLYIMENNKFKFFILGCWNNKSCDENKCLRSVIDKIKINKNKYKFGIIAGDNIYPQNKKYNENTLISGFECLKTINLPLYIVLGNHDTNRKNIMNLQLEYNSQNFKVGLNYTYLYGNCLFIFVNTNNLNISINYNQFKNFLVNSLNKKANLYVIVGHHPLISCKIKNKDKYIKQHNLLDILDLLTNKNGNKKIYYLCADTHNYQNIKITNLKNNNILNHIVIGTGGAKPDSICSKLTSYISNKVMINDMEISREYKIEIEEIKYPFGYCEVFVNNDKLNFDYIQTMVYDNNYDNCFDNKIGGYFQKYLELKNMYKNSKKN